MLLNINSHNCIKVSQYFPHIIEIVILLFMSDVNFQISLYIVSWVQRRKMKKKYERNHANDQVQVKKSEISRSRSKIGQVSQFPPRLSYLGAAGQQCAMHISSRNLDYMYVLFEPQIGVAICNDISSHNLHYIYI